MSPAFALMLLGKKAREPFGPPTWMVCVTRLPVEPVAADVEPDAVDVEFVVEVLVSDAAMDADDTEDWAAAKPTRAEMMKDFEKYMVAMCIREGRRWIINMRVRGCVRVSGKGD
jgi:hypothetical protein